MVFNKKLKHILTRRSFRAARNVNARRIGMRVLAASRQMPHQSHLKEVARRLDAMIVQIQLMAQVRDAMLGLAQRHLPRLGAHADVELAVARRSALRLGRHKLTDRTGLAMARLLELHLRHNNVVLQHRSTARADRIAAGAVHLNLDRPAVLAFQTRRHFGDDRRNTETAREACLLISKCLSGERSRPGLVNLLYYAEFITGLDTNAAWSQKQKQTEIPTI